jgi:hypothetical protein
MRFAFMYVCHCLDELSNSFTLHVAFYNLTLCSWPHLQRKERRGLYSKVLKRIYYYCLSFSFHKLGFLARSDSELRVILKLWIAYTFTKTPRTRNRPVHLQRTTQPTSLRRQLYIQRDSKNHDPSVQTTTVVGIINLTSSSLFVSHKI